jgi:hypothetical protein
MKILLHAIGYACIAFSIVGFIETAIGLATTKAYALNKVMVYSVLLGVGLAVLG